ncbi:DNA-directed RNA polymerase, alpha subunit, putative [Trypanosoma cruzi]|uniref:Plastid-encoded RNA polymerase subunit alpha n=1 Tax=Trypanosoma cruzi TaxID=5693 RepID=A0A2V2VZV5_TRYCR|nr:DNA-directed RNA polymerase, alpha subunit, putative [Trypanosoma cruzi]KAF8282019.1 putative DNA-directed RNA polymerases I and III subunit RPAC1 [Trypanosoma cruzi]PWV01377.1 putative DNA-directed RNA polymerase I and III subunit RPAC1 [Trypanosoma cruzi]RNF24057.1 putative DNA-directed RNA polymerase, alpha subunit [Trypanosoma cruzi]
MSYGSKLRVGCDKALHTETFSAPGTHGRGQAAIPPTALPDVPTISNIKVTSAAVKLPRRHAPVKVEESTRNLNANEEEAEGNSDVPVSESSPTTSTTRRVETMTFDVERISPPIANMFRRLMMTEVPVLAFDRMLIEENDSVVPDELLAHRIGLVPIAGPVLKMQFVTESNQVGFDALDPQRVLVFELAAEGRRDAKSTSVYSGDLKWKPLPGQEAWATGADEDRVFLVHPDIILTKLGPGQRLKLRAIALKGIGGVHAKWTPVSVCFYELKTSIYLREPIRGDCATKLQRICPVGVFGVNEEGESEVAEVENCTLCRECLRRDVYPEIADKIVVEKDKTRMRFTIESIGQLHASQIFRYALALFAERVRDLAGRIRGTEAIVTGAAAAIPST